VPLVEPSSAGRRGPPPELVRLPSLKAEAHFIAERLKALHQQGRPWNEMAVVYRSKFIGEEVTQALRQAQIPVEWLQESKQRRHFDAGHDSVKVLTMHSSKGLEFPVVAPGMVHAEGTA
jgi:superfamily I DNA/RNA helicase